MRAKTAIAMAIIMVAIAIVFPTDQRSKRTRGDYQIVRIVVVAAMVMVKVKKRR